METLVRNHGANGGVTVEGINPANDGDCFKSVNVPEGQEVRVTSGGTTSPEQVSFGEVGPIPTAEEPAPVDCGETPASEDGAGEEGAPA
jgi:hypothetical protein